MSEQPPTPPRSKTNIERSKPVQGASSHMNNAKMTGIPSKQAVNRSPSNYYCETMEIGHPQTVKVFSRTACYDKHMIISTQQYFRDDWGGVTAIRYFQSGDKLAVGFNSGDLQICSTLISTSRNGPSETILKGWEGNDSISCIRFHPKKPTMLYASSTAGTVMRRDLEDTTNYNDFFISEAGNEIYSMDFTGNGSLVTVGIDGTVRLYDSAQDKLIGEMGREYSPRTLLDTFSCRGGEEYYGKRIYSVHCHPDDPSLMLTGGWGGVRVWDLRTLRIQRSIHGPFIFGDTLDLCKGMVLTASCMAHGSLQIWDLGSGFLIDNVNPFNKRVQLYGEYPYAAKFYKGDPTGDLILYGVGGLQLISVKESTILCFIEDEKPVEAIDSSDKKFAFGGKSDSVFYGKILTENEGFERAYSTSTRSISNASSRTCRNVSLKSSTE